MYLKRMLVCALDEAHHGKSEDLIVMVDVLIYVLGPYDARVLLARLESRPKTPRAFVEVLKQLLNAPDSQSRVRNES